MRITTRSVKRLGVLLDWWGIAPEDGEDAEAATIRMLDEHITPTRAWEALATLRVEIPDGPQVRRFVRAVLLGGARAAIIALPEPAMATSFGDMSEVTVLTDRIMADVHDTARTDRTTGIQRVVRETVRRWEDSGNVIPVAWDQVRQCIRLLTDAEHEGLHGDGYDADSDVDTGPYMYVVPLGGYFIVSELAAESWRCPLHQSISEYSSTRVGAIGYDLVPVMSSETSHEGIIAYFPRYLDSLAAADRIATISGAAATEYGGWRRMLVGSGRPGPDIRPILLAADTVAPPDSDLAAARRKIGATGEVPVVVSVGSHEPRKNHLAILQAARRLWDDGISFRLAFVGGNAWGNDEFVRVVDRLQAAGRPLKVLSRVTDGFLAACYCVADFTVFPSLNEGFGLPVLESLTAGTPVITSDFGSMREIGEQYGGVLMIDPRDDDALREAMRTLLTDAGRLSTLRDAARSAQAKTWDAYAAETLEYFTQ